MSARRAISTHSHLREAAVSACWRQWRTLGASLSRTHEADATAVIDLEALILLSLALQPAERRLGDAVAWWATTGARLTSVQRLRTLARRGPPGVDAHVSLFAGAASAAGDRRWIHLAKATSMLATRRLKGPDQPRLMEPAALMPRLRAAFGVGAKADVLLFLLTAKRADPTARDLATALNCTARAARMAAEDMTMAGLVDATSSRPRRYSVRRSAWAQVLLGDGTLPTWGSFSHLYTLIALLLAFNDDPDRRKSDAYIRASAARDLLEAQAETMDAAGDLPKLPEVHGKEYLAAFDAFGTELADHLHRVI